MTWKNRFGPIANAINYFSSTEDVLNNSDGVLDSIPTRDGIWVTQEMWKGTTGFLIPGNCEGGWGFSSHYDGLTLAQKNALTPEQLRENSFFYRFDDAGLYDIGTVTITSEHEWQLLADAIPALSNPTGRNSIGATVSINRDMGPAPDEGIGLRRELNENEGWPKVNNRWEHSDIKKIAYPYNYKVFDQMVLDGGLD